MDDPFEIYVKLVEVKPLGDIYAEIEKYMNVM